MMLCAGRSRTKGVYERLRPQRPAMNRQLSTAASRPGRQHIGCSDYSVIPNSRRSCTTTTMQNPTSSFKTDMPLVPPRVRDVEEMVAALTPLEKKTLSRFYSGAMSYGSISFEAHKDIAEACNRIAFALAGRDFWRNRASGLQGLPRGQGPFSNSGEGGELRSRDKTVWQSRVRQVASGRFGVTGAYLAHAAELQIKISQGAKPGIGGELPGHKVTAEIAQARMTTAGVRLVSPPPHHDVYSIEDLKQLIYDLRSANPEAPVSVKLAAADGIDVIAAGAAKAGASNISIAGPGGTGATPTTAKYSFVHDWETGLASVHQMLCKEGLRDSVSLTASGGLQTGLDCFKAILLGADNLEIGTQMLVSLGCTMAEVCHKGTCPVGIATTDQDLIDRKYKGSPMHAARTLVATSRSLARYLEQYGFNDPSEAVGRTDLLEVRQAVPVSGLDKLLAPTSNPFRAFGKVPPLTGASVAEIEHISRVLGGERKIVHRADNQDLSYGARFSFHSHRDPQMATILNDEGIQVQFSGFAPGQSLGFVAPRGLEIISDVANDGTGKSLDGGSVLIRGWSGNQTCYGATSGLFASRFTGDRSFVRNSGARAVVESMGQMGCNFMTGGSVAVLGHPRYYVDTLESAGKYEPAAEMSHFTSDFKTAVRARRDIVGANFGAGMSGGQIILPRALLDELREKKYLSDSIADIPPTQLTAAEVAQLKSDISTFARALRERDDFLSRESIVPGLDAASDDLWDALVSDVFVKIDPRMRQTKDAYQFEFTPVEHFTKLAVGSGGEGPPAAPSSVMSHHNSGALREAQATSMRHGPKAELDACGTGVIVDLKNPASRNTVRHCLTMLSKMSHRGARGIDPDSGDGCGVALFGTHDFHSQRFPELNLKDGEYGIVAVALPKDELTRHQAVEDLNRCFVAHGLDIASSRDVPTNPDCLGYIARMVEPAVVHFVVKKDLGEDRSDFERRLTRARLLFELSQQESEVKAAVASPDAGASASRAHVISASSFYVIYKALSTESALQQYYAEDLGQITAKAGVAHSRFATNTLPAFKNIQPLSRFANNGENNGLELLRRTLEDEPAFAEAIGIKQIPALAGYSDSHIMSLYMDCLYLMGASAEDIVSRTVLGHDSTGENLTSQYMNLFAMPFEGPNASIVFTEDKLVVVRDKNGFRPQRGIVDEGNWLYSGSELGTIPELQTGRVFDLAPAEPFFIDLSRADDYGVKPVVAPVARHHLERLAQFPRPSGPQSPAIFFNPDDLLLRKRRAGWTEEVERRVMSPLFALGQGSTESMGDQGPLEALVRGSLFELRNFFKGKFSQVTNPALARNEEQRYMSTETYLGRKPRISEVITAGIDLPDLDDGVFLPSPVIDNEQMAKVAAYPSLRARVIDITFDVQEREAGLARALDNIRDRCVQAVKEGSRLLVLSDLSSDDDRTAVPPVMATAVVDRALRRAGIRRDASIVLQAAPTIGGADIAQAISIGGADAVNPYLVFVPDGQQAIRDSEAAEQFARSRTNYLKSVRQEILGFMARMGISSVSVYRGTKGFDAIGLDGEVADLYGVDSFLGGVSMQDISRILLTNHRFITDAGLGKYEWIDQEPRKRIWNARTTNAFVRAARGEATIDEDVESETNKLKSGNPRGWLGLRPPRVWNHQNPLRVCILGGGAAGFYQAQALLENSTLPLDVAIIERQHVNKFGLLGDGIAPDHASTKRQGSILRELYSDPRVQYYGGIEIGDDRRVTLEHLREKYPIVIDCRGARDDLKLNVPGENSVGVVPASKVYRAYNSEYDPMRKIDWPFTTKSKNPVLGIIGGGNVAADIARIFVKDPDELTSTNINPVFLDYLRFEGPPVVRIFVRADPWNTKMSLKELNELRDTEVWMSATFDLPANRGESETIVESLDERQRELFNFFNDIKDRQRQERDAKRIFFHFGIEPESFEQMGTEVEAKFKLRSNGENVKYRASNFVTAIGKQKPATEPTIYTSGWATGDGGTLAKAERSAHDTAERIENDFFAGKYDTFIGDMRRDEPWQLRAVSNNEALAILDWIDAGRPLRTVDDFRMAKAFSRLSSSSEASAESDSVTNSMQPASPPSGASKVTGSPNAVTVVSNSGTAPPTLLAIDPEVTLLQALKRQLPASTPTFECDGELTCGTCHVAVAEGDVERSRKEIALLKANGVNPKERILSCAHNMENLRNTVVVLDD